MIAFLVSHQTLFDFFLLSVGFAYSQQVALRAGVFSVATAGLAALGAYAAAIGVQRYGISLLPALAIGTLVGMAAGLALSLPLARLRGVFQAIATLAFVQVVVSLAFFFEGVTGGALGIYNIPKLVETPHLLIAVVAVVYIMWALGRSGIGRAFDAIRQDETVAAVLGVSISRYHTLGFALSGAFGGLFGALQSLYVYSIEPHMFGFGLLVSILSFIILGGRRTVVGPIVGTAIMIALPEIIRPLAENRQFVQGALMILMMAFLPHGVVDSMVLTLRRRRAVRRDLELQEAQPSRS